MAEEIEGQLKHDDEVELDPEAEIRRRLALAQIRQYPDPVLRMKAHDVTEFDDDLRGLVSRMEQLMQDAQGVGLAATQVGILRRVFVFQRGEEIAAVVNPEISERSDETEIDKEGCLSLQGVSVPVERAARVTLRGKDVDGGQLELELEGYEARIVQHELDHLEGTLLLDRTTDEARKEALAILRPKPILSAVP